MKRSGLQRKTPLRAKTGLSQHARGAAMRSTPLSEDGSTPEPRLAPKAKIKRTLKPGEPDPPGEPRRYRMLDGSYVLRWKVGVRQYVERIDRTPDGAVARWKPYKATYRRIDPAEAKRLYDQGLTQPQIAARLGFDNAVVSRALNRVGATIRKPGDYAIPIDVDDVVARYASGQGSRRIARDLGIFSDRVKEVLRGQGVELRGVGFVKGQPGRLKSFHELGYQKQFERMRPVVRRRSGGRCEARASARCSGVASHVHHRKLRSQGGTNDLWNLLDACQSCHQTIHMKPAESYRRGWLVHPWQDPREIDVR